MELIGKKALVTGGSGDLGTAIVRALANAGVDVAVSYVSSDEQARKSVNMVSDAGRNGFMVHLDQRDPESIERTVETVISRFGTLDILVNNAAWNTGIPFTDLDGLTVDVWDRIHETNLRGPFLLSRAFASHLKADGYGRVVNIASVGGIAPNSSSIAYSASKAGLIHLTRCLAVAMAPEVAVNCVAPGLIENSRIARNLPTDIAETSKKDAILGKTASVNDIAEQVILFCKTDTISGQIMVVDGGVPGNMR